MVNKLMMPFGIITFAAGMFMFLFEALVACLQAYIFAILTTAYINMSYRRSTDRRLFKCCFLSSNNQKGNNHGYRYPR